MAFTLYTEDQLFAGAMGYFRLAFPGVDLGDRSFLGLLARSFARFFVLAQYQIERAANDSVPAYQQDADGNVRSRCSSEALDAWAFVFGLPSGTPGIYGRRGATVSTGGVSTPTVTAAGVVVPASTQATDPTGQVTVQTVSAVTLTWPLQRRDVQFVSVTKGAAANLPAGTRLTWVSPPAGLVSSTVLSSPLVGAQDIETDAQLVARILRRIQQPPRGGTAADYRLWAEESVDSNGASLNVGRAYVYPLREGLGSVTIVPTYRGSGLGRVPPSSEIAKIQAYLDKVRPVTATAIVRQPSVTFGIRIRVKAQPSAAKNNTYAWDWNDTGGTTAITARTANTITVAAVPARLQAAFNAGTSPRIQVCISTIGASPIPFVARVTNIVGTTITLDPPFDVLPQVGDYFRAGSSIVIPVAQRILDYVDSLGPSRQSGYADPNDFWEDSVLLERITDAILETRDSDGTRMVQSIPSFGSTGILIAVDTGPYRAAPYIPLDFAPGDIRIAFLLERGIEVLQV